MMKKFITKFNSFSKEYLTSMKDVLTCDIQKDYLE